jgi:hypothetical protein
LLSNFWSALAKYLEKQPYWPAVQPFFLVVFAAVALEVAAYQYVRARYGATTIQLFLGSYLSVRILVAAAALLLLMLLFKFNPQRQLPPVPGRIVAFFRAHRTAIAYRGLATLLVVVATGLVFLATSPGRARPITIRIMDLPADVASDALTYLVYELNRPQRQWYFEIDARPFNELALTSVERDACANDEQPLLCYTERKAGADGPLIAITSRPLNDVYFATHRGLASVITTADAASYAPLTNYEYLAYLIVIQSMLIQLDAHGGRPADAFAPRTISSGGAFEFVPGRDMLKAAILAPRLSPEQEALIFNRFGPSYLRVCADLLSLDWLYTARTKQNLKLFGVALSR